MGIAAAPAALRALSSTQSRAAVSAFIGVSPSGPGAAPDRRATVSNGRLKGQRSGCQHRSPGGRMNAREFEEFVRAAWTSTHVELTNEVLQRMSGLPRSDVEHLARGLMRK